MSRALASLTLCFTCIGIATGGAVVSKAQIDQLRALERETRNATLRTNPATREQIKNPGRTAVDRAKNFLAVLVNLDSGEFAVFPKHWIVAPAPAMAATQDNTADATPPRLGNEWEQVPNRGKSIPIVSLLRQTTASRLFDVLTYPVGASQAEARKQIDAALRTAQRRNRGLIVLNLPTS